MSTHGTQYQFEEPIELSSGKLESVVHTVTDAWIAKMYYPYWLKRMKENNIPLPDNPLQQCIDDWVIVNWAVRL